ncbi:MAG: amidohydrolase family protein [Pseudomonadales bacterium]|nr:amidohydrolase family protein [Pseudomonadales bacterium]
MLPAVLLLLSLSACERSGPAGAEGGADARTPVDLLIRGGRLLDGLGRAAVEADLWIDDGRILKIVPVGSADEADLRAETVIEAQGRVVAPGFIDPHSHGDPLATPDFENFLAMGVTTITLGQDGSSPETADLAGWLSEVEAQGIGPNLAMFVGHGTLRDLVGIGRDPAPSHVRLETMLGLLDRNLDVAFGLSTGLEYNPGLWAKPEELQALARVVGARDRVIMSHLRNEDDEALEASLQELLRQGEHARVHVAHLKSVYGRGAARGREILALLEDARARGVRVSADVYPYTASYTGLALLFPPWAKAADQFEEARATRDAELADYLRRRVEARNGPEATLLGTAPHAGKTLAELATEREKPFERVLIDDLGPQGGSAAYFIMDDELQTEFIADPNLSICSDGSPTGFHPRGHGTFARIIERYVLEEGRLSLAEAVRKMTSLPAAQIGLAERGALVPGHHADVIVFDPARVRATATYEAPLRLAEGFDLVIVNGQIARRDGRLSSALSGAVLRPDA